MGSFRAGVLVVARAKVFLLLCYYISLVTAQRLLIKFDPAHTRTSVLSAAAAKASSDAPISPVAAISGLLVPQGPHQHKFVKESAGIAFELPKKANKDDDDASKENTEDGPANDELWSTMMRCIEVGASPGLSAQARVRRAPERPPSQQRQLCYRTLCLYSS